jgi:hypothetical protein
MFYIYERGPHDHAAQMRAARAMLGIDQRQLAKLAGVLLPTIQRMEASDGTELIGDNMLTREGGRGVRLNRPKARND